MRFPLFLTFLVACSPLLRAEVVRPAPPFSWQGSSSLPSSLYSIKGRSAVLLITPTIGDRKFLKQLREIQSVYQLLAAAHVFCFVSFTEQAGRIPSNIPFIVTLDGPRVGADYKAPHSFSIALIGADGNLDYCTPRVVAGQRILDIIYNSFASQEALRK